MLSSRSTRLLGWMSALAALTACGGAPPPAQPPAPSASAPLAAFPAPSPSDVAAQSGAPSEEAHRLAIRATACWLGGVWSDALGEPKEGRKAADEARCHDVVKRLYGSDDGRHYNRLRALEAEEIAMVVKTVDGIAKGDAVDGPRREPLVRALQAFAAAEHEAMEARRAANRVKRDVKVEPEKLSADEVAAVAPLRTHAALEALMKVDAGELAPEAHALFVVVAMDRLDVARDLPKHLKIYAVADAFALLFGVAPPDVPADATKPLKPGTWLAYLADAAKSAGHEVPAAAKRPADREPQAWTGVLAGYADKLRPDADKLAAGSDLGKVAAGVVKRLDAEVASVRGPAAPPAAKK